MPTDRVQCNASDVNVWVSAEIIGGGSHDYTLTLEAKPGVSCYVSGSPTLVDFLTASGEVAPVAISTATPIPTPRVVINANHLAQIDINTRDEAGTPVSSLRFNIPSSGENTTTTIAWTPGSIAKHAHFSAVRAVPRRPSPPAGQV
ncbi:DUF4232 domain-containing protein [Lentzea jiangxiensis]|nr:DUF4232 domain-containing protein [Lentzea jiangxiensis]